MTTAAAQTTAPSTSSGQAIFKRHVLQRSIFDPLFEKDADAQDVGVSRKVVSYKAVGEGKPITPDQLARINRLAPKALTIEEVYYRSVLLAHNGLDRDNERFHEDLLDLFAKSISGKGFFVEGHPGWSKGGPGKGRIFDAHTEAITPEQFQAMTGETLVLPEDVATGKVLIIDFYMLKLESNADTQANIDGGIYCFASIGFSAPLYGITDERGNEIYGEYRPKGEALEGSLVWLGAQPGAGAMKGAKPHDSTQSAGSHSSDRPGKAVLSNTTAPKGEMSTMDKQLLIIGTKLGKTFKTETFAEEILAIIDAKGAEVTRLTTENAVLLVDATDGKAFRKSLVDDVIRAGVILEEIKTDESSQKAEEAYLMTVPIERLKTMAAKQMAQARKQFPDKFELPAGDQKDREKGNTEAQAAGGFGAPGGKSPLLADAEKRAAAASK